MQVPIRDHPGVSDPKDRHNIEQRMITETLATNSGVAKIEREGVFLCLCSLALLPGWTLGISGVWERQTSACIVLRDDRELKTAWNGWGGSYWSTSCAWWLERTSSSFRAREEPGPS